MKTKIKNLLGAVLSLLVTFGIIHRSAALARILIIGLAFLVAAPGEAAPNNGGDTGGETIYYIGPWPDATSGARYDHDEFRWQHKTPLGLGLLGVPSWTLHNNRRWFVCTQPISGQYYPNGTQRREVFALRDDYHYADNNNASTRVLLTDDVTLEPWSADWVPGDQRISFTGRRWSSADPDATVVEGGLYTASLVFGVDGNIVGLAAQPITPAIPIPLVEPAPGDLRPDFLAYSWAPTANMVAYSNRADNELWVGDLLGARLRIYNGSAHMPQWSPAGDKIAFTRAGTYSGIWTIKPNGVGAKWIIRSTSTWFFNHAYWSSTGSHLVFVGQARSENNMDLFRATATGGNLVQLTSTPAPFVEQMFESQGGWR